MRQDPNRYVLVLPLPPNVANPGRHFGHWAAKHAMKKRWSDQAALAVGLDFPATCFTRARVKCIFYVWNLLDADNLAARQKWILDFLRKPQANISGRRLTFGGWIMDDDPSHLELLTPEQTVDRKNRRVMAIIENLARAPTPY